MIILGKQNNINGEKIIIQKRGGFSIERVVFGVSSAVIIFLAFAFYFTAVNPAIFFGVESVFQEKSVEVKEVNEAKEVKQEVVVENKKQPVDTNVTKVIYYKYVDGLTENSKTGFCQTNSLAQPFRQDTYNCSVDGATFDPCFSSQIKDKIICPKNPLTKDGFYLTLTKPLPKSEAVKNIQDNWAWFLELDNGMVCAPFTVKKPIYDNNTAFYGCLLGIKGQMAILIDDLKKGSIWTAKKAIIEKNDQGEWKTKSVNTVNIKTVWQ